MRPRDDILLRDGWIAVHKVSIDTPEHGSLFWAWERLDELCSSDPEEALAVILAVLRHDQSDRIMENLAAGPLEDLLARHPYRMIDAVEIEAKKSPQFSTLLGGVWQSAIPDDVWCRVLSVRDRRGWDGIPAE